MLAAIAAVPLAAVALIAAVVVGVAIFERATRPADVPAPHDRLPPSDAAPVAAGRLLFDSNRTGTFEIWVMDADGSRATQLTDDDRYDSWWPRLSPDRTRVLFYRTPAGTHDTDYTKTALWMMEADGTGQLEIRPRGTDGWHQQGHAEWSPDGSALVMFGGARTNPQIWLTDASGSNPRKLTNRSGVSLDPSFSPDGREVAFIGCPRAVCFPPDYEVYTMPVAGGDATRLTDDSMRDQDPYYSPDGSRIAWLTQERTDGGPIGVWNIRIAPPDGSAPRWLTHDENVNSKPEWSRDGTTIFFHRLVYSSGDRRFGIWQIRPDGTGLRPLTADQQGVNEFPSA